MAKGAKSTNYTKGAKSTNYTKGAKSTNCTKEAKSTNSSGRVGNVYKKVMMEIMIRRTSILPLKNVLRNFWEFAKNNERLVENSDGLFEKIS